MKTFLFRSMIGIFFGAFLAVVVTDAIIYFGGESMIDGSLFLKNSLGSIFCGWFFTVTPLYFEIQSLKLWQQTLLHFITVSILYFTLALVIGWFTLSLQSILWMISIFLIMYACIWIGFYFYFKNLSTKLNEDLKRI
jgi:hypothetical protein